MKPLAFVLPVALSVIVHAAPGVVRADVSSGTLTRESAAADSPRSVLTADIRAIAAPGSPGTVLALRPNAHPIILGRVDGQAVAPVVVAATWEKGRVVAFGHSGYLGATKEHDTAAFVDNCVRWAAGDKHAAKPFDTPGSRPPIGSGIRVGLLGVDAAEFFASRGYMVVGNANAKGRAASQLPADWHTRLKEIDVLVISEGSLSGEQLAALRAWTTSGGGMIALQTGWGWQQLNNDADMRTNALNRLLFEAGIGWTDEIITKTGVDGKGGDAFAASVAPVEPGNLADALDLLQRHRPMTATDADKAAARQASAIALRGVRLLPETDTEFRPRIRAMLDQHAGALAVSEKKPLKAAAALERFLLAFQVDELQHAAPTAIKAHPAAAAFPGAVAADAQRADETVTIDTRTPKWHSLGLYAPAGEVVTITIPESASGKGGKRERLSVRIGCHTDQLWHHDAWKRVPRVAMSQRLETVTTQVASPFGGLIYIDVPDNCTLGEVKVGIKGAVRAPLFVLGKTDVAAWKERIRNAPGAWAEFATDKVIVSVPSSAVRGIDDPTDVLKTWNEVLDAAADLATIPRDRKSPQRYVADVQISAGYMHSGYPIMTHLDAVDEMTQNAKLRAGSWGLFHELGHNHQDGMWTFNGTTEVTCNLFSLYIMETVSGKKPGVGHDAVNEWTKRRERAAKHLATGANFDKWKADPFLALEMYIQLREAFGWDVYKKVFAEYRALPQGERPKTDQDKRDQWMVRFSNAIGKNLGPFFDKWGVPVSEKAKESIKALPVWMPEEMTKK